MTEQWHPREYQTGDEAGIRNLFHLVFNKKMSVEHGDWQYTKNPAGESIIYVADSGQDVVGHFALMPVRMKIGDQNCIGGYTLDAMTHPDYKRQGIFPTLAKEIYGRAVERGMHFLYAFENENSYPPVIAKLGHHDIYRGIPLWARVLSWQNVIEKHLVGSEFVARLAGRCAGLVTSVFSGTVPKRNTYSIHEVTSFDERFNELWKDCSGHGSIMAIRDREYLTWRYIQKPEQQYAIFVAEKGEKLTGYIILKCVQELGLYTGFIMDVLTRPEEPQAARELISSALGYFKEKTVDVVGCLMVPGAAYSRLLGKAGFIRVPRRLLPQAMYWTGRQLTFSYPSSFLFDYHNWFITWGDHDTL